MSEPDHAWSRRPDLPSAPSCAACGRRLTEPYGWCAGCRKAYCFACGRSHYCTRQCPANGCIAGLCVRVVRDGRLSERWGIPADE